MFSQQLCKGRPWSLIIPESASSAVLMETEPALQDGEAAVDWGGAGSREKGEGQEVRMEEEAHRGNQGLSQHIRNMA